MQQNLFEIKSADSRTKKTVDPVIGTRNGIGSHQSASSGNDEWLTPPEIIKALGEFDLDPCSPIIRPWPTAAQHYTIVDDGLSKQWAGRVWLNPPYGHETVRWIRRLADHGNGIALTFARTETKIFFNEVWPKADAVFFVNGRLYFHNVNGGRAKANSGGPSCLIAYGGSNVDAIRNSGILGKLIDLRCQA